MNIEDIEIRTAEEAYLRGWMMGVNERIERIERIIRNSVDTPKTHAKTHTTRKPKLVLIQGGKE